MNEQLFKLRKDGKCVGFLKIASGFVFLRDESRPALNFQDYNYFHNTYYPIWDTVHPFVTTDKNGEKVFAGDKVKVPITGDTGVVTYEKNNNFWGIVFQLDDGKTVIGGLAENFIELIKEKPVEGKKRTAARMAKGSSPAARIGE